MSSFPGGASIRSLSLARVDLCERPESERRLGPAPICDATGIPARALPRTSTPLDTLRIGSPTRAWQFAVSMNRSCADFSRRISPTCRCPARCQRTVTTIQAALGHLLHVLRADGSGPARRVGLSPAIHDELARFASHLEHVCGLAEQDPRQ